MWYYSVGSDRKGPVDENAMQALIGADVVHSETLIWSDGMADWEPAYRHIKGLVPPAPGAAGTTRRTSPRSGGRNYAEPIGMGGAFSKAFKNFVNFRGRASRGEFWWFMLASILIGIVFSIIDASLFDPVYSPMFDAMVAPTVLGAAWNLVVLFPTLAVSARRLHDIGKSGWWWLIALTGIGIILLIVWWAQEGDKEANAYG